MMDASLSALLADLISGVDQRAERAAQSLGERGPDAFAPLRELLRDPNADRRWWAVRALAEVRSQEVPALLAAALMDEDVSVRQCAALGLCGQPDPVSQPALLSALEADDRLLARLAGEALAALGSASVPGLIERLGGVHSLARGEAARALALIGDKRSIPALFEVLEDDSPIVTLWAEEGLARMGVGMVYFPSS